MGSFFNNENSHISNRRNREEPVIFEICFLICNWCFVFLFFKEKI